MATSVRIQDSFATPIGRFVIVADEEGRLIASGFEEGHARMEDRLARAAEEDGARIKRSRDPGGLRSAIQAYFDGELHAIDALPVQIVGTPFQKSVWNSL